MRAFVQRLIPVAIVGLAALPSGGALAQSEPAPDGASAPSPTEQPEEITVRGPRSLSEYRVEMERARDEVVELFNELNSDDATDVRCREESQTGTRTRQRVCRSNAENRANANAANTFLDALLFASGRFDTTIGGGPPAPAGGPVNAAIGTGQARGDAVTGAGASQAAVEREMERLLYENPQLYRAAAKFIEAENEYNRARGSATVRPEVPNVPMEVRAPAPSVQCGATATTEYRQANTIARVSSALSISDCAAASGAFTIVLRTRDDSDVDKSLEFSETWQRSDDQDVKFAADYPIGENVFLVSARLRGLTCTCAGSATQDLQAGEVDVTAEQPPVEQ